MKDFKKKKLTDKDWEAIHKIPMAERYIRINASDRQYLQDKVTKSVFSLKRDLKKQMKESLLRPTGRQLKKLKKYLKQQNAFKKAEQLAP